MCRARSVFERALAALWLAWMRRLLKVAIADVAARGERDCRAVGLCRAEILAGLMALHSAAHTTELNVEPVDPRRIVVEQRALLVRRQIRHDRLVP
jgi:hypothetical protein